MLQGFYNLASGMITQNRNMEVIGNNIVNISTPGYKKDTMVSSTFQEEMLSRTGNTDKRNVTELNTTSKIRTATETITNYSQGSFQETNNPLDIALAGPGFFQIRTQVGNAYTRNGAFIIDQQGYLSLPGVGRLIGQSGEIQLESDKITVNQSGDIFDNDGNYVDTLNVVDFADYSQVYKQANGTFTSNAQPQQIQANVMQNMQEASNVEMVQEMTAMMTSQRAIQSASQIIKMYDQMMGKATTEIGRV